MPEDSIPYPTDLTTERLRLRPFSVEDTAAVVAIQSNWNVTRNLRMAGWPATEEAIGPWLAFHREEWRQGTAYRFALIHQDRLVGCCDMGDVRDACGALGYWLAEDAWGRGFASEASRAVVTFSIARLGLTRMETGHVKDNPASGHVLTKLGFVPTGERTVWSRSRRTEITQCDYALDLAAYRP